MFNKNKLENMLIEHDKDQLSKVKSSKTCNDKMHECTNDNYRTCRILKGDLTREEWDEEDGCKLLFFINDKKGLHKSEWRALVKKRKHRLDCQYFQWEIIRWDNEH